MMSGWAGGGFGWVSMILMLAFLAFVVVGIVFIVRGLTGSSTGSGNPPPTGREEPRPEARPEAPRRAAALDVLEERYARGEIDREEFVQRKKDLTG